MSYYKGSLLPLGSEDGFRNELSHSFQGWKNENEVTVCLSCLALPGLLIPNDFPQKIHHDTTKGIIPSKIITVVWYRSYA